MTAEQEQELFSKTCNNFLTICPNADTIKDKIQRVPGAGASRPHRFFEIELYGRAFAVSVFFLTVKGRIAPVFRKRHWYIREKAFRCAASLVL